MPEGAGSRVEVASLKPTSKAINTDWFTSNQTPINTDSAQPVDHVFIIKVATATIVRLLLDDSDESITNSDGSFNGNSQLTAGTWYKFYFTLLKNQSYNIQHTTATQNVECYITEHRWV
jgi:hypothetical protein